MNEEYEAFDVRPDIITDEHDDLVIREEDWI